MRFQGETGCARVLSVWSIAVGVVSCSIMGLLAGLITAWLLIGAALLGIATVIMAFWYAPRYAKSLQGSFDGQAVRGEKGVLWRKELFIPMNALRTYECWTTPVQRYFHCQTIILRFAGGAAVLPLLPTQQAKQLMMLLEQAENQNGVSDNVTW